MAHDLVKHICVARDGREVLVSYYLFRRAYFEADHSFSDFFDDFLAGRLHYGSRFEHVAAWRAHAQDPKCSRFAVRRLDVITPVICSANRISLRLDHTGSEPF